MKTAFIAGCTGLVGKQLLQLLLASDRYTQVIALTRQDLPAHPKLLQIKTDFDRLEEHKEMMKADDVFCCLGTTMAKARSKENFYKVDFHYPYQIARILHASGARQFVLVSAVGADKTSSVYYNRVKGEVEEAVAAIGYEAVHIVRPSLLLGPRKEKRAGEDAAKFVFRFLGFLIPKKYKGIDAAKVARAMLRYAALEQKGIHIHESTELQEVQ